MNYRERIKVTTLSLIALLREDCLIIKRGREREREGHQKTPNNETNNLQAAHTSIGSHLSLIGVEHCVVAVVARHLRGWRQTEQGRQHIF